MGYESPGVFKCRVWWLCVCAMINTSEVINYPLYLYLPLSIALSLLLYSPISTYTCLSSPDESFEAWISTRPKCIRRAARCLSFGRTRLGAWIRFGASNIIQGIQGIHPIRGIVRRSHPHPSTPGLHNDIRRVRSEVNFVYTLVEVVFKSNNYLISS